MSKPQKINEKVLEETTNDQNLIKIEENIIEEATNDQNNDEVTLEDKIVKVYVFNISTKNGDKVLKLNLFGKFNKFIKTARSKLD